MAHNLEIRDGIASFVSVKEPAWHKLGTIVNEAMTQDQVLKLARLDYTVELTPITVYGNELPDRWAIGRPDTKDVFGFVKNKYQPIQNEESFGFFNEFLDKSDGAYQTAGVLFNGEAAWILAKLPDHCSIRDSKIDLYVLYIIWHDGKTANQVMLTPTRVVCWNTLMAAMRNMEAKVSIRHFENFQEKQREAVRVLGIKNNYFEEITKVFESMAKTSVTKQQADAFVNKIVTGSPKVDGIELSTRASNKIAGILDYYLNHPTQQEIKGTAFGLYNAVTGYYQNVKTYNKTEGKRLVEDAEKRFNNIFISGDAQRESEAAFHYAMMLV